MRVVSLGIKGKNASPSKGMVSPENVDGIGVPFRRDDEVISKKASSSLSWRRGALPPSPWAVDLFDVLSRAASEDRDESV